MDVWEDWFRRAEAAKEAIGAADVDIAAVVAELSPRKAQRAQVNHWFKGRREPTISQFMALCLAIGADPGEILFKTPVLSRAPKPKVVQQAKGRKNEAISSSRGRSGNAVVTGVRR